MDKGDLNINLDLDELAPIKKQYKKLKKNQKSNLSQIKRLGLVDKHGRPL